MSFNGITGIFLREGDVKKSDIDAGFAQPVINHILGLQGCSELDYSGVDAILGEDTEVSDRLLLRTASGTKSITIGELNKTATQVRPILAKEDLGIMGDSVTDDGPALQAAAEYWSGLGGAAFMLRSQPGKVFFFKGTPRLASNISVIFVSPHKVTNTSRLTIAGGLAETVNANQFRLLVDAAEGDTFIRLDTSPHGGGAVSSYFAAGDYIRIRGLRDSCGTAIREQEVRVTTVTDGTARLDLANPLNNNYEVSYAAGDYEAAQGEVNTAEITKVVSGLLISNVDEGSNLIPLTETDAAKFSVGDYVMLHGEDRCSDIAGTSTFLTHVEQAQIISSVPGDAAGTLRLSRRIERDYTTAKFARLIKLNPVRNSIIQSATVEFTQVPGNDVDLHPFEMRYCVDCVLSDCSVPNTDIYGTKGAGCAGYRCLACNIDRPVVRAQKYVDSGQGNGAVLTSCTDCRVTGGTLAGTRHALQAFGSTNCVYENVIIQNPRQSPLDCHGGHEVGIRFVNITATAATDYRPDPGNAPVAITFGNTTHLAGAHRCLVEGGRFAGFRAEDGNSEAAIKFFPPSTDCSVKNAEFNRIGTLFNHVDVAGFGTLVTRGCKIENCSVFDWSEKLVEIFGRANGASLDTLVDFTLRGLIARNGSRLIDADNCTELEVYDCVFDEITEDLAFPYVLSAEGCSDLVLQNNLTKGTRRGIQMGNCTNFRVIENGFVDLIAGTVLQDGGGNTGIWVNNSTVGTTPTYNRAGGSVITEGPRAAGVHTLADDTAFAFIPERKHGVVRVWSHGGSSVWAEVTYRTEVSLRAVLNSGTATANVEVTTGNLTGTTGTDGKFTVSAADGKIWIENRTGGSVVVDFSCS